MVLGGHDALLALRRPEQVAGLVVFVSGAAIMAALALRRVRFTRSAFVCLLVGTIPGLLLAASQAGYDGSWTSFGWLVLVLLPATGAAVLICRGRLGKRGAKPEIIATLTLIATVSIALVGAIGGAFRSTPSANYLDIEVRTKVVGHRVVPNQKVGEPERKMTVVEVAPSISNIGNRRIVVTGSSYSVEASKSQARAPATADWQVGKELQNESWTGQYEQPAKWALTEYSVDPWQPETTYEPEQHDVGSFYTLVPSPPQINTARVCLTISTALSDRLLFGERLRDAREQTISPGSPISSEWTVMPTSWVARLIRGEPVLGIDYALPGDSSDSPQLAYSIGELVAGEVSYKQQIAREANFYGAGATVACGSVILDGALEDSSGG
jgi:hypothetical protein